MIKKEISLKKIFEAGIIKENPVLRSALGLCPALAITTSALNGLGMGIATAFVLIFSNMIISIFRKVIPDKVRIPAFIVIISALVAIMQMLVRAFAPTLDEALGIFLPLVAVNCIVFGRGESFARKNKVFPSVIDGFSMGVGNMVALILIGSFREVLGVGTWFGIMINNGEHLETMGLFVLPPGGLLVLAFLVALMNKMAIKNGKEPAALGCKACPSSENCQTPLKGGC